MATTAGPSLQFGSFRLDLESRHLWQDGQPVHLTPKVFDILVLLVTHSGSVLSKEEIMSAVWPDRHIEEANLTQSISILRKALGETQSGVKYVVTFPGKGYQFCVPVHGIPAEPVATAEPVREVPMPAARRNLWGFALASLVLLSSVAAIALWRRGSTEPVSSWSGRQRPLSRLPGAEYHPVFSRQGTKVAFVWDGDGTKAPAIFVRGIDEDEARPITQDPHAYSSPAWSPDGHHLAALRQESSALKLVVIPVHGGREREVAALFPTRYGLPGRHADWSPDGRRLVVDDKTASHEPFHLFLIDAGTGERRQLTTSETSFLGDTDPRFSPDGQLVNFVRQRSRLEHDLYTVPIAGGPPLRRTQDQRSIGGHDWSADGRWLVWSSNRDDQNRLWRVPLGSVKAAPEMVPAVMSGASPIQFSISRSVGQLVYSDFWQDLNIWRFDTKPGPSRWSRAVASTGEDAMPQLSPDGQRLCFQSSRSGNAELWVSAADGSGARQITRNSRQPAMGRWSPDGASIVYFEIGTRTMYRVDPSGGLPKALGPPGTMGIHPVQTRAGQVQFTLNNDLYSMPVASTGPPRKILPNVSFYRVPSPNEAQLYVTEGRTEPSISRITLATGERQKLVQDLLPGYWGAWALGSRGIYYLRAFSSSPTTTAHLAFYDFASGAVTNLAPFLGPLPPIGTTSWSLTPDERYLYVVRSDNSQSDVILVDPAPVLP